MKLIKTEDAVGSILCHDITQIIPGVVKDAVFRKGHVVTEEDIPVLLSVGKEHLYVWEQQEGMLHENDAAEVLRQVCQGEHMKASEPKEGKIPQSSEEASLRMCGPDSCGSSGEGRNSMVPNDSPGKSSRGRPEKRQGSGRRNEETGDPGTGFERIQRSSQIPGEKCL